MDKDQKQDGRNLDTIAPPFNQEVVDCPSPPRPQLIRSEIGLNDWMDQAKPVVSRDEEEQVSPEHLGMIVQFPREVVKLRLFVCDKLLEAWRRRRFLCRQQILVAETKALMSEDFNADIALSWV